MGGVRNISKAQRNREVEAFENDELGFARITGEYDWFGGSFGRFSEDLYTPSLDRILMDDFGLNTVGHRVKRWKDGSEQAVVDVLGYSPDMAIVVKLRTELNDDGIDEFLDELKSFPVVFREYGNKKIFCMLAAVKFTCDQQKRLEEHGIYVARRNKNIFRIVSTKAFEPADFGSTA